MIITLPSIFTAGLQKWAENVIQIFGTTEIFDFPVDGIILYLGSVAPDGWVEETPLAPPAPEYIYIRKTV